MRATNLIKEFHKYDDSVFLLGRNIINIVGFFA